LLHPVGYWSRGLTAAAKNYSTKERECLDVVWTVLKLRHFLDEQRFLIQTDHQALRWIYSTTDSSGRLMRRQLRLSEYTFDMVYKPGASHHLPDFLLRVSTVAPKEDIRDDISCLALAETANGIGTGRYKGTTHPNRWSSTTLSKHSKRTITVSRCLLAWSVERQKPSSATSITLCIDGCLTATNWLYQSRYAIAS